MAISNVRAIFKCNIKTVWDIVTNLDNYSWRSDLSRIEVMSHNQFIEYTKDGYATKFTITETEPCRRWEFDIENDNIQGHWTGIFSQDGEETIIDFTEDVTAKRILMKPFIKAFLKRQQLIYIADLKKAVEKKQQL